MTEQQTDQIAEDPEREALKQRCMEVCGDAANETLAEVLSYFPEKAELFIRTQEYAAEVNGERGLCYALSLKEGDVDFQGYACRVARHEYLDVHGYSGRDLMQIIKEIRTLRGELQLGMSTDEAYTILRVNKVEDSAKEHELMVKKVLEIMEVTDEELGLLKEFYDAHIKSQEMHSEASTLESQARALRKQAREVERVVMEARIGAYRARRSAEA